MNTTKDIIRKVTDIITIVFPAAIAVAGTLEATGVVEWLNTTHGIVLAVVAGISSIASIIYNVVTDVKTKP